MSLLLESERCSLSDSVVFLKGVKGGANCHGLGVGRARIFTRAQWPKWCYLFLSFSLRYVLLIAQLRSVHNFDRFRFSLLISCAQMIFNSALSEGKQTKKSKWRSGSFPSVSFDSSMKKRWMILIELFDWFDRTHTHCILSVNMLGAGQKACMMPLEWHSQRHSRKKQNKKPWPS